MYIGEECPLVITENHVYFLEHQWKCVLETQAELLQFLYLHIVLAIFFSIPYFIFKLKYFISFFI